MTGLNYISNLVFKDFDWVNLVVRVDSRCITARGRFCGITVYVYSLDFTHDNLCVCVCM